MLYALAVEFADSCRKVVHLESKVAQTGLTKSGKDKDYRYRENSLIREFKLSYRTIQIVL